MKPCAIRPIYGSKLVITKLSGKLWFEQHTKQPYIDKYMYLSVRLKKSKNISHKNWLFFICSQIVGFYDLPDEAAGLFSNPGTHRGRKTADMIQELTNCNQQYRVWNRFQYRLMYSIYVPGLLSDVKQIADLSSAKIMVRYYLQESLIN